MVEQRVDHFLVAVHHLEDAVGCARFLHQLGKTHGDRRIALRGLEDEGVATRDGSAEHPHRDHRREVERGDARDDAERLAHRIDVDPGARAMGIFSLERMGDATRELDHLEPTLDVALRVGDDLAMFGGQQLGELLHVSLEQHLEVEHDARAPLRVGRCPAGERRIGRIDRALEVGRGAEPDACLDLAAVGIEHVALSLARGEARAVDEMVDSAHGAAFRFASGPLSQSAPAMPVGGKDRS